MKFSMVPFISIATITLPNAGSQVGPAKVQYVGAFGNEHMFLQLDVAIAEPGCDQAAGKARKLIRKSHPYFSTFLSLGMSAHVSRRKILVKPNGCRVVGEDPSGVFPLIDESASSYLLFNPR